MGFNIDTRGHKKAQKRQNIAVGPEDPPRVMTGIQNPGWQRVKPEKSQTPNISTRSRKYATKLKYTPVPFRKTRYEKSPIPYLTQLLNDHYNKKRN